MSELCSILSFGAAGSTKMVVPGTNQIQRAFNVKYPTEYIQRPEKWQANQTAFAPFMSMFERRPRHGLFPERDQRRCPL